MRWCAQSLMTSLPRVTMTSLRIPSIPSKLMRLERRPTYPSTPIITSTEPRSRERGLHGYEWLGHLRQDKLEIIEDKGILHEVKHFPCCLQEKYPCSCP